MKNLLCTLMLATIGAAAAQASVLTITFDHPDQIGSIGQTVQFFGTITNTSANTVFLNSDAVNLASASIAVNDLFLANVPISLAPSGQAGDSSGDIELFDLIVSDPLLDPPATYLGIYDLVGGADADAQDLLATAAFSLTTTTPEPSTMYLLLAALLMACIVSLKGARKRA